jgi:hypothetical protein
MILHPADATGLYAGAATLATFFQVRKIPMRCFAIVANLLFIAYALLAGLLPILALQGMLLPLNVVRLRTALNEAGRSGKRLMQGVST